VKALETLGPDELRATMVAYRDALRAHQDRLNRLNVYPVPDGDTGTNMALTLESVVDGLDGVDDAAVAKAVTHGSLMGARGNSGVILSQILKGLADGLGGSAGGPGPVGADGVAAALLAASRAADQAVMHPVEGTILTVARDAAAAAKGGTVLEVLESASAAAAESLENTPILLPVLADAGVVDAGGAGYVLLLDALLHVADGRPLPEPPAFLARPPVPDTDDRAKNADKGGRYEVMYFLETADEGVDGFKQAWDAIGDSIVVVGGEGVWNCHIHTDDIGAAIDVAIDTGGRPRRIRVTDLHQEVADEAHHRGEEERQRLATGVVAVAAGDGVAGIMASLGVQEVVTGGQSMNPSTAQIVAAIDATHADAVIVLPNNKNVVPVAEQAVRLGAKPAQVVPTRSVAEGLASLLAYNADVDVEANMVAMVDAAQHVAWGEITRAVRDAASTPAGPVKDGDWLGLDHGSIAVIEADLADAACRLLERLVNHEHEIVTVIYGDGASTDVTGIITGWLAEHRPGAAAEVHDGGQPLSAYLFSAE